MYMLRNFKWAIIYFHKLSLLVSTSIKRKGQHFKKWFLYQTFIKQNTRNNNYRASVLIWDLTHCDRISVSAGILLLKRLPFSSLTLDVTVCIKPKNCIRSLKNFPFQSGLFSDGEATWFSTLLTNIVLVGPGRQVLDQTGQSYERLRRLPSLRSQRSLLKQQR